MKLASIGILLAASAAACNAKAPTGSQICADFGVPPTKICSDEMWFTQTLDHFRFSGKPRATFQHRYLMTDQFWGKGSEPVQLPGSCKGPVLFYTGNEGPIDAFWGSNGFMINHLAPKWGALLLFGEERYYGKTQPFGADSLSPTNAQYMSTEQVLADYAKLLTSVLAEHNASDCPVVSFGGSYGGTLSTYFRRIYPALTVGALAASAPIGYYSNTGWKDHGIDQYTWIDIVQKGFSTTENGGTQCFDRLKNIVATVGTVGKTASGRETLAKAMHLCSPDVLGKDPTNFLIDALETLPQLNYPYQIGSLPKWPVNATCKLVMQASPTDDLGTAAMITDFFYGYDGSTCLQGEGQGGIPGGGPGPASWGTWGYQSCTETLHQFSSSASGHGFRDFPFNLTAVNEECQRIYGVQPDPWWAETHWGGYNIGDGKAGMTNIIWSNGGLDPWHGGGFMQQHYKGDAESNGIHFFFMPQGAHHLDLRGPNPEDPANVTATREAEEAIIKGWIESA